MAGSDGDGEPGPGRTLGGPGPEGSLSRLREWVVVDGDRFFVAVGFSIAVFAGLLGLDSLGVVAFLNDDSVTRIAGGMVAGSLSLVTLVVSINQLILSREFTSADEFQERLEGVLDFRDDVATATGVPVAPAAPSRLFVLLTDAIERRADALEAAVADHEDDAFRRRVEAYVDAVFDSTGAAANALEDSDYGTFEVVSAAVRYDDARQIYAARRLRDGRDPEGSAEVDEALEDLLDALRLFKVAREHFKSQYLQRELTRFSQLTIYAGVPAVLAACLLGFLYADFGGAAVADEYLPYAASGLVAVVLLPLGLLGSFILRTAAVGRRTSSVGPVLPSAGPEDEPFGAPEDGGFDRDRR